LFALILSGRQTQTLPVGLSALETHRGVEIALLAAATLFAVLPVFESILDGRQQGAEG
jgi:multiple sugar transport system permease protein